MKNKTAVMKLNDIKETFYVRVALSEEHVLRFAELYEHKAEVPLIKVTEGTMQLIDGRHRKAAMLLYGLTEAEVELVAEAEFPELIIQALKANVGGSLPPSKADIQLTIKILLEKKVTQKWIISQIHEMVGFPKSLVRRWLDNVHSELSKAKKVRALNAVTEGGMTVPDAAKEFGVDPETIKDAIRGKRKKAGELGANAIKGGITTKFKSLWASNGRLLRKLSQGYEDGEVTKECLQDVLAHIEHQVKNLTDNSLAWQRRLEATLKGVVGPNDSEFKPDSRQNSARVAERVLQKMGVQN